MLQYLITDPNHYSNSSIIFQKRLISSLKKHSVDIASFRDKQTKRKKRLAQKFVQICKKYNIKKVGINKDIKLAKLSKANTVHLTSKDFSKIRVARAYKLYTIVSTHNKEEIKLAKKYRADMITYSPIFHSPNKGKPKGVKDLKNITKTNNIPIIALGGITSKADIDKIKHCHVKGFASIRYFF